MKLINIGFGNMVNADRVIAVVSPDSAPIKRIVQDARDKGAAIDATYGRRTRAVIITDSDHVVLSAFEPEEVLGRFEKNRITNRVTACIICVRGFCMKGEKLFVCCFRAFRHRQGYRCGKAAGQPPRNRKDRFRHHPHHARRGSER